MHPFTEHRDSFSLLNLIHVCLALLSPFIILVISSKNSLVLSVLKGEREVEGVRGEGSKGEGEEGPKGDEEGTVCGTK